MIKLKYLQELELLKKCLDLNKRVFPIIEPEFDQWLKNYTNIDKDFIKNAPKNLLNINLQIFLDSIINSNVDIYDKLSAEKYIENVNYFVDSSIRIDRKYVTIFRYKKLIKINTGQKFGDHALSLNVRFRYIFQINVY